MVTFKRAAAYIAGPLLSAFLVLTTAHASSSPGTSVFNFLKLNPTAQVVGMGDVSSVVSSQSIFVNPGILPWIRARELSLQHLQYLENSSYSMLSYVHPVDKNFALTASLGYTGMGGLVRTVADASPDGFSEQGEFAYSGMLASVGYGKRTAVDFSYGLTFRAVQETIDGKSTTGVMVNLGGYYYPRRRDYRLGFGVFNVGPQIKNFDLPSGAFFNWTKYLQPELQWVGEGTAYLDQAIDLKTGFEYAIEKICFLRAGLKYPLRNNGLGEMPATNLCGGIGFNFNDVAFDYAWLPYGDLGTSHRLTLTARFGSVGRKAS